MKEATSAGGVIIYRGKILLLYKNFYDHYHGWVLPKGTVEKGESLDQTALREVKEEAGAKAKIVSYLGATNYSFKTHESNDINKTVHWYLMSGESFFSKPQREEFFEDSGFYKYHEAYYLLKFDNERSMLEKAYEEYKQLKSQGKWED